MEAAHAVLRITTDRSLGDYQSDEMVHMAVERGLTVVGEALSVLRKDAPELAALIPSVNDTIGLRNVLVHGYADIDDDTVWHTATVDLTPLIATLENFLRDNSTIDDAHW